MWQGIAMQFVPDFNAASIATNAVLGLLVFVVWFGVVQAVAHLAAKAGITFLAVFLLLWVTGSMDEAAHTLRMIWVSLLFAASSTWDWLGSLFA